MNEELAISLTVRQWLIILSVLTADIGTSDAVTISTSAASQMMAIMIATKLDSEPHPTVNAIGEEMLLMAQLMDNPVIERAFVGSNETAI